MSRELTKSEDIFPALSGLARIVGNYTKSEYVAGMWASDLRQSLAWAKISDSREQILSRSRHSEYIAPTWSWASVKGTTIFSFHPSNGTHPPSQTIIEDGKLKNGVAIICSHSLSLASTDPYGQVASAVLTIEAPILNGVLGYQDSQIKNPVVSASWEIHFSMFLVNVGLPRFYSAYTFSRRSAVEVTMHLKERKSADQD